MVVNSYSHCVITCSHQQSGFLPVRRRHAQRILHDVRTASAAGPDRIAALVLHHCASSLALPLSILGRRILQSGTWPSAWKSHWLQALHKKKARSDPNNYREVHLTSQLGKAMERLLGSLFQPFLEKTLAYGPNQFAYSRGRGGRDALLFLTLHWLLAFSDHRRVALFCSDVKGAFDHVPAERLLLKAQLLGVHPILLRVLESWLSGRTARVVVGGDFSDLFRICNSVFQGTVWGPRLWNLFFGDARYAVNGLGFIDSLYADDLNCFKLFDQQHSDAAVMHRLAECQSELHVWGAANQVVFDPGKESLHILDPERPVGDSFRILGVLFDTRLTMKDAVMEIAAQAHVRLQTVLRTHRYNSVAETVRL